MTDWVVEDHRVSCSTCGGLYAHASSPLRVPMPSSYLLVGLSGNTVKWGAHESQRLA